MAEYKEINPLLGQLKPYILSHVLVSGTGFPHTKTIIPKPFIHLTFDFNNQFYNGGNYFRFAVSGLHEHPYPLELFGENADRLMIRFRSYGLCPFTRMPLSNLANRITTPERVFGSGVSSLFALLKDNPNTIQRIGMIEDWLLAIYREPSAADKIIFELADRLLTEGGNIPFVVIQEQTPFSMRQIERKFKWIIGVSVQSFMRICRLQQAKTLLSQNKNSHLTGIGYDAGYYDQPHFSREFKNLTGSSPKKYVPCGEGMMRVK